LFLLSTQLDEKQTNKRKTKTKTKVAAIDPYHFFVKNIRNISRYNIAMITTSICSHLLHHRIAPVLQRERLRIVWRRLVQGMAATSNSDAAKHHGAKGMPRNYKQKKYLRLFVCHKS
jgi:hypothetical protein